MFFLLLLFQVRKVRTVKPINHGAKIMNLRRPSSNQHWFYGPLKESGLLDLVYLGYATVPHALLMTLCERWHTEISSFHMPLGEMTTTLDDVTCLMHLPIKGRMLSHPKKKSQTEGANMMVRHLDVMEAVAEKICGEEYGAYIGYKTSREYYENYLDVATRLAEAEDPGVEQELQRVRTACVKCYLLYLVGCMLFGDKSNKRIELVYLRTMEDGYVGMRGYS